MAFLAHPLIHSPLFPLPENHNHVTTVPEIRWFSARGEPLPLCGHATMATTMLLLSLFPTLENVRYRFPRGVLAARRLADGRAEIDLPASARVVPLDEVAIARTLPAICRSAGIEEGEVVYLGGATSVRLFYFPTHSLFVRRLRRLILYLLYNRMTHQKPTSSSAYILPRTYLNSSSMQILS